ncbi:MAG: EAL domain-containing protein, partial [Spirochaetales bacterium]|nr:EAL domain-containing protein [Spirochaetales bacterium]
MVVDFTYQYQYELCSLIFLCCLTVQYFASKRFPTTTGYLFQWGLLCAVVDLALDVAGSITLAHIETVPIWVNYAINGLFYMFQTILPALMTTYVIYSLGFSYKGNPKLVLTLIPGILIMMLQITTPFTGLMFSIRKVDGVTRFIQGPMIRFLYITVAFYLVVLISLVIIYRLKLSKKQIITIIFFSILVTISMVLQMIFPNILLTGMGITIAILLWDLTLQNPEHMMDEASGAYNLDALNLYLERSNFIGHLFATVVDIDGLSATDKGIDKDATNALQKRIGDFFSSLKKRKVWYFKETRNRFWVFARNLTELEQMSTMIVDRFNESWSAGGFEIDLLAKVLYFSTSTSIQLSGAELIAIVGQYIDSERMITRQMNRLLIDSELLAGYRRRNLLEESLRHSFKTNEGFHICFQPIVSLRPDSPTTAEVLLRYNDPNLGPVSPTEFIPIIENTGLAMLMDNYVVDAACQFLSKHPEIDVLHINLSASEFYNNPVKRISSIVLGHGVSPSRVCFEITESAAARSP